MPLIPLGISSYERNDGLLPETRLVNMFIEQSEPANEGEEPVVLRLQRPGLQDFNTIPGAPSIDGMFTTPGRYAGNIFVAANSRLWAVNGVATVDLGAIGPGAASFAANSFFIAVVTDAGLFYYDDFSAKPISIPDGYIPVDVTEINGYFIVACSNGRYYWIVPGQTTIDPLNFATAESSPDGLVGVRRIKDEILFFGTNTVEVWQPTGDQDAILRNAAGRQYDRGCLDRDTIRAFDNSLLWVGEDGIVYRVGNTPIRVSNYGIEERIKARSAALSAWTFPYKGHLFYVLRIPGQGTFVFDASTNLWSEFNSDGYSTWRPAHGVLMGSTVFCGDDRSGNIWLLDDNRYNDAGVPFTRLVTGTVMFDGKPIRSANFSMSVGTSDTCNFRLRWKAGREDFPATYTLMEARDPVDIVTCWRLGRMNQPFHTFEVSVTEQVKIRITGAKINEAYQGGRNK